MIRGILIKDGQMQEKEIWNNLDSYYQELGCDTIDVVARNIGGRCYNIVCDDEGLYHDGYISMMDAERNAPMLVGNLFICNNDDRGRLTSLTDEDCTHIKRFWKFHTLWGSD